MPADVIVSSVFIRLRHPQHEAGQTNQFDATTQEWIVDADGKATPLPEKGPFTPQQLDAKGLGLPVLMNQALQTAVRDRVDALAVASGVTAERDALRAARDAAIADKVAAEAALAECQSAGLSAVAAEMSLRKKLEGQLAAVLQAKEEGPANPVLNALSFGLLGN